jgi:hypothetical protein
MHTSMGKTKDKHGGFFLRWPASRTRRGIVRDRSNAFVLGFLWCPLASRKGNHCAQCGCCSDGSSTGGTWGRERQPAAGIALITNARQLECAGWLNRL